MTCTDTHPYRPDLRHRAERLIAALDAAPAPRTLPDIMRAARTLIVIDRLLTQLWKTPPARSGRQPMTKPGAGATAAEPLPDDAGRTILPVMAVTPPLNRHQRRLQAARDRSARPHADTQPHHETG
ncbi:MAG TPA: hypothetical protein VLZ84_07925 [Asticcacaulis sp.]|nr:hypothetical protein [Asticcacaulis sp.]